MDTGIAVQLYTLREFTKTPADIARTLKKVREIGYRAVQCSALGPIEPRELRAILDQEGLFCCATHTAFDKVRDLLKEKDASKINNADALKDHLKSAIEFLKAEETKFANTIGSPTTNIKKDELATFFIRVTPTISITADGTHPLVFIILDLEALGTAQTLFYKKENGEVAHWDIFLSTTTAQAEIESYFLNFPVH